MNHLPSQNHLKHTSKTVCRVFKLSALAFAGGIATMHLAFAQQLAFPSAPPGTGGAEPAPNVIISIDDSGSMGWDVNGCITQGTTLTENEGAPGVVCPSNNTAPTRLTSLRNALIDQFGNGTSNSGRIADGRIRLAWQSMWNNGNTPGARTLTPGGENSMRPFENSAAGTPGGAQHRTNFNTFITGLSSNNGTPSHSIASRVDTYMRDTSVNSPWKNRPGVANSPELSCRRSYHVFMTDGSWNTHDGQTAGTIIPAPPSVGNVDGIIQNLPTPDSSVTDSFTQTIPTQYTPFSAETRLYSDNWSNSVPTVTVNPFRFDSPRTASRDLGTLSDFAFNSWVKDLQPNISNAVKPILKKIGNETFGTGAAATTLPEFWNPKNNPATWQHVVTHTIGFGRSASTWAGAPVWDTTLNANGAPNDNTYGGDFVNLLNGSVAWQNPMPATTSCATDRNGNNGICTSNPLRASELWHMALNGRGKFYPARTPQALTDAFNDILSNILADTSKPLTSIAANTRTLKAGANTYIAGYSAKKWSGTLAARGLDSTTATIQPAEVWNAATLLDDRDFADRFIFSYGVLPTAAAPTGFAWTTYAGLPSAQQAPLNRNSAGAVDGNGADRFNFIRGERTKEETATPAGIFRSRASKLGDIVNSSVWYTGAPDSGFTQDSYGTFKTNNAGRDPMIYIGANDGMLHGFSAATGVEKMAYIPQGIAQGTLRNLADTNYAHRFYVDGHPFTGDFYNGSDWKTALVGTLGAGGKGYFVLDATNPTNFNSTQAPNLVIADTTASTDAEVAPYLGHIFSKPVVEEVNNQMSTRQIVRMNNNRWAMVTGNGYNSTNEVPVLIIQYLDGDKRIKKVSPCISKTTGLLITPCDFQGANGLSAPQLINLNGDGTADVAYAGDLQGNLWKFNLSSSSDSNWEVSFANRPFFIARTVAKPNAPSVRQAITNAPYWTVNKAKGGVMVLVATGKNLTKADQTTTGEDTFYGLHDVSAHTTTTNPSSGIKTLTITDTTPINLASQTDLPNTLVKQSYYTVGTVNDSGYTYYRQTENAVDYEGSAASAAKRGWYISWPKAGQRVLNNIELYSGSGVFVQGVIPASEANSTEETCTPQTSNEKGFVAVLNAISGAPVQIPAFKTADSVNDGVDFRNVTLRDSDKPGVSTSVRKLDELLEPRPCAAGLTCKPGPGLNLGIYGTLGVRANWRETQQ